jgi:hypothetical protein
MITRTKCSPSCLALMRFFLTKATGVSSIPCIRISDVDPCSVPSAISFTATNIPARAPLRICSHASLGHGDNPYDSGWIEHFNDTHTHAEVLALLDKAMVLREAERAANVPSRAWRVVGQTWKLGGLPQNV